MKAKWLVRIAALALFLIPVLLFGQDAPFPGDELDCEGPFGPVCPIDGGVSFLIAAGVALGGKKAYDRFRNEEA